MEEEFLKELESKVGRKTPQSLLEGVKDAAAADCDDVDSSLFSDDISGKIARLKQEMRLLRSTDVRILRQLLAVHEGVEAVRWILEERAASGSQSSSRTGSLSSLLPVDELGLSLSRYRDSLSSPWDLTEDIEEDLDLQLHTAEVPKNHLSPECPSETRPSVSSAQKLQVSPSFRRRPESRPESRPQPSDGADPNPVRSALLRSSRASRREEKTNNNLPKEDLKESKTELKLATFEDKRTNGNKIEQDNDKMLLGYDARWSWIETQDDVTFL